MKNNPVASTVMGMILIGILGAIFVGIPFGLEILCCKFTDKHAAGIILSAPILVFFAFLLGDGFLANRSQTER